MEFIENITQLSRTNAKSNLDIFLTKTLINLLIKNSVVNLPIHICVYEDECGFNDFRNYI